jgi:hypothetical protein
MKKILFILALISLLSCSKNENVEEINPLKEKLVGSWREVGYEDDWIDPETGSNYHQIENGSITTFYLNGSLNNLFLNVNYSGDYHVTTDSILTINHYNSLSGSPINLVQKIRFINNNLMKTDCNINNSNCPVNYYERIITP